MNEQELSFEKFWEIYKKDILPKLKNFENDREIQSGDVKFYSALLLVGLVFCLIMHAVLMHLGSEYTSTSYEYGSIYFDLGSIFVPFAIAIAYFLYVYPTWSNKAFKIKIKQKILPQLLDLFGDIAWNQLYNKFSQSCSSEKYKHRIMPIKAAIPQRNMDKCGLFTDEYTTLYIDDQFSGSYKEIPFQIAEIKMQGDIYTIKSPIPVTTFKGILISFQFNKKILARTIVHSKFDFGTEKHNFFWHIVKCSVILLLIYIYVPMHIEILANIQCGNSVKCIIVGIFAIILCILFGIKNYIKKEKKLEKIKLEDDKFNKRFNVYSSDEVEARYLVTPLFMELLSNLQTAFGTNKLKCSFFDDNLMIAISTKKDLFELGDLHQSCNGKKFVLQFWKELSSIYKMVEYFRLNKKIFLS